MASDLSLGPAGVHFPHELESGQRRQPRVTMGHEGVLSSLLRCFHTQQRVRPLTLSTTYVGTTARRRDRDDHREDHREDHGTARAAVGRRGRARRDLVRGHGQPAWRAEPGHGYLHGDHARGRHPLRRGTGRPDVGAGRFTPRGPARASAPSARTARSATAGRWSTILRPRHGRSSTASPSSSSSTRPRTAPSKVRCGSGSSLLESAVAAAGGRREAPASLSRAYDRYESEALAGSALGDSRAHQRVCILTARARRGAGGP